MNLKELIELHDVMTSICKDADEILNGNFTVSKMNKLNEDLKSVKEYLENRMIEHTSIKKSLSDKPNTTDRQ